MGDIDYRLLLTYKEFSLSSVQKLNKVDGSDHLPIVPNRYQFCGIYAHLNQVELGSESGQEIAAIKPPTTDRTGAIHQYRNLIWISTAIWSWYWQILVILNIKDVNFVYKEIAI